MSSRSHPDDIGVCTRCGRWQRRRYAYAETFGPGDRVEWCVTGNCAATWQDDVMLVLAGAHTDGETCCCAVCRERDGAEPSSAEVEHAASLGAGRPPGQFEAARAHHRDATA